MRHERDRDVPCPQRVRKSGAPVQPLPRDQIASLGDVELGEGRAGSPARLDLERFELSLPGRDGVGWPVADLRRAVPVVQLRNGLVLGRPLLEGLHGVFTRRVFQVGRQDDLRDGAQHRRVQWGCRVPLAFGAARRAAGDRCRGKRGAGALQKRATVLGHSSGPHLAAACQSISPARTPRVFRPCRHHQWRSRRIVSRPTSRSSSDSRIHARAAERSTAPRPLQSRTRRAHRLRL